MRPLELFHKGCAELGQHDHACRVSLSLVTISRVGASLLYHHSHGSGDVSVNLCVCTHSVAAGVADSAGKEV